MSHKTVLLWACALVASWVSAQDTQTNNINETAATASLTAGGEVSRSLILPNMHHPARGYLA